MIDRERFEDFMLWSYPTDIIKIENDNFQQNLTGELDCLFNEIDEISKERLVKYFKTLSIERRKSLTQLFRILTGVSRINFEISFLHRVNLKKNQFHFEVINQKKSKNLSYCLAWKSDKIAIDEQGIAKISQFEEISVLLIDYFSEKNLLELLTLFKNDKEYGKKFLEILSKFDSKGKQAQNRGKKAENIIKEKLIEWGLDESEDFNTSDLDVFDQISKKLQRDCDIGKIEQTIVNEKIKMMKKHIKENSDFKRLSDIVLYLNNPSLLIQSIFYTSDVASIADATADELNDEQELIQKGIKDTGVDIKLIGLIDGPGLAITISFTRVLRILKAPDDFFQIRTASTKLRDLIRKSNNSTPLDIEIGVYSINGDLEVEEKDLLEQLETMYGKDIEWEKEITKWANRNKISKQGTKIGINSERRPIFGKYTVLDLLNSNAKKGKNKNIILPENKTIDKKEFEDFIKKSYPFLKNILEESLENFKNKLEIIVN